MKEYVLLFVSAALVNNVILARFLGLCSFMGVTTRVDTGHRRNWLHLLQPALATEVK